MHAPVVCSLTLQVVDCCNWCNSLCNSCSCLPIDRKIQENEFPHQLYVQNYSTKGGASDSCIVLKKWIFSRTHEVQACTSSVVQNLIYHQVSTCHCKASAWWQGRMESYAVADPGGVPGVPWNPPFCSAL